jgi:tetratricopeptide (TPR) repeat protein
MRAGGLAGEIQDYRRAKALSEEALAVAREIGDSHLTAGILHTLGFIASQVDDYAQAIVFYEQALTLLRAEGLKEHEPTTLYNLGEIARWQGDYNRAIALYREALAICEEMGDTTRIAWMYRGLGCVALEQRDYEPATRFFKESLTLLRDVGEKFGITEALEFLARAAAESGPNVENVRRAARLLGAAALVREHIGYPVLPTERPAYERCVAGVRAYLGEDQFAADCAEGRAMTLDQAIAYALE